MKTRGIVQGLHEYVAGEHRKGTIKLSSNENPFGPSRCVSALVPSLVGDLARYPDSSGLALRRAIARRHDVEVANVLLGNGSDELLTLIAAAYLDPDDAVVVARYTFSQYRFAATLFAARTHVARMPTLQLDLGAFTAAVLEHRPRIVFVCSPNNPTGGVVGHEAFSDWLAELDSHVLVVADHAYQDYVADPTALDATGLLDYHPNLIVLRTFSKVYGLASARVGYALAHADRIAEMSSVRSPFNVGGVSQALATAALSDREHVAHTVTRNAEERDKLRALLQEVGYQPLMSHANFVCVDVGTDSCAAATWFAERGFTIRALESFGLPTSLRISVGTPEQMRAFGPVMRAFARRHRRPYHA